VAKKQTTKPGGALGDLAEGIGTLLGKTEKKASQWLDKGSGALKAGVKRATKTVTRAKKAAKKVSRTKTAKRIAKASKR
jgi:hypothetical protein